MTSCGSGWSVLRDRWVLGVHPLSAPEGCGIDGVDQGKIFMLVPAAGVGCCSLSARCLLRAYISLAYCYTPICCSMPCCRSLPAGCAPRAARGRSIQQCEALNAALDQARSAENCLLIAWSLAPARLAAARKKLPAYCLLIACRLPAWSSACWQCPANAKLSVQHLMRLVQQQMSRLAAALSLPAHCLITA
jgi:hypothetical protein